MRHATAVATEGYDAAKSGFYRRFGQPDHRVHQPYLKPMEADNRNSPGPGEAMAHTPNKQHPLALTAVDIRLSYK